MTNAEIKSVLTLMPRLTEDGNGICDRPRGTDLGKAFLESQNCLLNSSDECRRVSAWLFNKPRQININWRQSAYGLKHIAEDEIGYVTNGAFIAAAIHAGLKFKVCEDGLNVCFNLKTIRRPSQT